MSAEIARTSESFRELMFSDFSRYRPRARPGWLRILVLLPIHPGLLGSLVLRAQQRLHGAGRIWPAWGLRTLGNFLVGADFVPGARVGRGLMLSHPVGIVFGPGCRVGDGVTCASGVVLGVKSHDEESAEPDDYPTVGDGVFLGAHAVVLGGVVIGDGAMVGANAVVTSDVAPGTTVVGNPAKPVGRGRSAAK